MRKLSNVSIYRIEIIDSPPTSLIIVDEHSGSVERQDVSDLLVEGAAATPYHCDPRLLARHRVVLAERRVAPRPIQAVV